MPIGRLMKKIQCQEIASVSTPPASRPIEPPAEATKPKTPIALACSRGSGNIVTIMPRITAEVSAPPTPCTKRAPISAPWLGRDRAHDGGGREDGEAGEEDAALADQVAEAARQQQQSTEGDQVGVDDPGEVALAEAEVVLDRGQRDVHDRGIQHDHQHAHAQHHEGDPARAVCGRLLLGGGDGGHVG